MMKNFPQTIAGIVTTDAGAREKYSRDASIFEVMPSAVTEPHDAGDLAALVRFANESDGVSLTARSAGTDMSGGPLTESVVVDFTKYFDKIILVTDDAAVVQPGVYYRDFEKATLAHGGQLMPSYPASRELCTVGGMVANNSGGELTLRYGKTIDYVKHLKTVLADGNEYTLAPVSGEVLEAKCSAQTFEGECYRKLKALLENNRAVIEKARPNVSKNSSGYYLWDVYNTTSGTMDLTKLFVGSQGTLGLISEIGFRLMKKASHTKMVVIFLDTLKGLGDLVNTVLQHEPTTFESYDDKTLRLALSFFGEFIKRLGWRRMFQLLFHSVPEGISIFRKGIPHLVLQVTFDGDDQSALDAKAEALVADMLRYHPRYMEIIKTSVEVDDYWLIRRESFNLLRQKVKGKRTAPFIDDIVVRPEVLPEFLPKLTAILEKYQLLYTIAGHIGNGNFHIIPLMNLADEKDRAKILAVAQEVYALVAEFHGSNSGEHNDGLIRTPFLETMFGAEMVQLFADVKKIFDPKNIFNPGKKVPSSISGQVGGSLDYSLSKIKKSTE